MPQVHESDLPIVRIPEPARFSNHENVRFEISVIDFADYYFRNPEPVLFHES